MLLCVTIIIGTYWVVTTVIDSGFTGELASDVFILLLVVTPSFLAIRYIWGKAEEINVKQHSEAVDRLRLHR